MNQRDVGHDDEAEDKDNDDSNDDHDVAVRGPFVRCSRSQGL